MKTEFRFQRNLRPFCIRDFDVAGGADPFDHLRDRLLITLHLHLHPAVPEILHPAGQVKGLRGVPRPVAEAHPLHLPGDGKVPPHRAFRQNRRGAVLLFQKIKHRNLLGNDGSHCVQYDVLRTVRCILLTIPDRPSSMRGLKQDMEKQRKRLQDYAREYYAMGNECITQARDARAALANYDKALELYPEYTDAWVRKGVTLFNENQYQEAEECLNHAVRLRPAEFKTVYNRGKLRLKLGNIEGAIADLDKATTLKPEHAGAHELFGDALMQAGKEVEAALQWRLAEELRKKRSSK